MTRAEFSVILAKISRFYPRFYEGQDASKVAEDWYTEGGFEQIGFSVVERAVRAYCNTAKFPPTLSDIKAQMVESYLQDKPTAMQAFQMISSAVKKSNGREDSVKQFNELPPILRKLVGTPSVLRDWSQVSTESFNTVIMSAIRESYKELASREAKYYAFPAELQMAEQWRIEAPQEAALPEPVKEKTLAEAYAEADDKEVAYRKYHGIVPNAEYASRVDEFRKPLTSDEQKMFMAKMKREEQVRLERIRA